MSNAAFSIERRRLMRASLGIIGASSVGKYLSPAAVLTGNLPANLPEAIEPQKVRSSFMSPVLSQLTVPRTSIHKVEADGVEIFYRAAGDTGAPVVLLLHGFPTSSFMFRDLIPRLADQYRLIAPDLPGFGFTEVAEARRYKYSFENLAGTIEAFTDALGLSRYAIYVFDYGAPTGFRLAMRHPERVTAIVSQNGNAYQAGLGDAWGPIREYWSEPTAQNREVLRQNILTFEATRWQYTHGVADPDKIAPESYTLDAALLERPGNKEIQLDLFLDYAANVKLYPKFQEYFRQAQPPLLAIWGKNDPFFIPAGADAFRTDLRNAQVQFLDTGHFALETHGVEIAAAMKEFLAANGVSSRGEKAA
jgi:pimeloyl-ACP methyl ester carboxylesterase